MFHKLFFLLIIFCLIYVKEIIKNLPVFNDGQGKMSTKNGLFILSKTAGAYLFSEYKL